MNLDPIFQRDMVLSFGEIFFHKLTAICEESSMNKAERQWDLGSFLNPFSFIPH